MRAAHKVELRRVREDMKSTISDIHSSVGEGLAANPVMQGPHPPNDRTVIPFFIHPSHESFYVGGFVACGKCGVCNSQPLARQQLPISLPCEPDLHGDMRPETGQGQRKMRTAFQNLRRLRNGMPPYGYRKWPDGSDKDVVKPIFGLTPLSEDPTARLFVPNASGSS